MWPGGVEGAVCIWPCARGLVHLVCGDNAAYAAVYDVVVEPLTRLEHSQRYQRPPGQRDVGTPYPPCRMVS